MGARGAGLLGAAAGLAASPVAPPAGLFVLAALAMAAAVAVAAGRGAKLAAGTLALALAGLLGLVAGDARLAGIQSGSLAGPVGEPVAVSGHLVATPKESLGRVRLEVQTANGKVAVLAAPSEEETETPVGSLVRASGVLAEPDPFLAELLERRGMSLVLDADEVRVGEGGRGGLQGRLDVVRARAEEALGRGMPEREGALARGFVLGQDEGIEESTEQSFKNSGLAHLLAVSGQNVILLCLLAWPFMALLGVTLRVRLVLLLLLVAAYVVVTGAGPSIQRAGIMGAAGLVAGLAGRPSSRWNALGLAAVATLALNPLASGEVGWQLSFAATAGIMLWSSRLASILAGAAARGSPRRAVAEGVAVTAAATLATAPLMVFHFEAFAPAALPANLLALPAVPPAMWLGMLSGLVGQVPGIPVEPLNQLNAHFLGYIAQIALWLSSPGWASLEVRLASLPALLTLWLVLAGAMELAIRSAARRRGLGTGAKGRTKARVLARLALPAALLVGAVTAIGAGGREPAQPPQAMRVTVLDVGQGDAILLEPPGGDGVLVDAGPPGGAAARALADLGVDSLAALVITHEDLDHAGGAAEVMREVRVRRLAYGHAAPGLAGLADGFGAESLRLAEGGGLRSGGLRLEVVWPPGAVLSSPADDLNTRSLVLLAEWRHFSMLLSGDAEAEAVPIDPGAVDVLKVAHHGSEDSGLDALLDRTVPKLAAISAGEGNPYGHPALPTLADLDEHGIPVWRTDENGALTILAGASTWSVAP